MYVMLCMLCLLGGFHEVLYVLILLASIQLPWVPKVFSAGLKTHYTPVKNVPNSKSCNWLSCRFI